VINEIEKKTIDVIGQVFETMFFTSVAVQQEGDEEFFASIKSFSAFLRGEIGFDGVRSGTLTLSVPVELAKTMASNFMGLEEETATDSQAMDMVNELCNMVCGNLFSRLDRKTVWNLTIPQTREVFGKTLDVSNGDRTIAIRLNAEGYPLDLQIKFTSAA
jgi:CheY-specific phosphatase CheX